jgi:hypothetical protein
VWRRSLELRKPVGRTPVPDISLFGSIFLGSRFVQSKIGHRLGIVVEIDGAVQRSKAIRAQPEALKTNGSVTWQGGDRIGGS